jgi:hypothetical protein
MRIYRLYFLHEDNDVIRAQELAHEDDAAAIAAATPLLTPDVHHIELWQSVRLVKRWPE